MGLSDTKTCASSSAASFGEWKYHIYATYCQKDGPEARSILQFLRLNGLIVYDHYADGLPGKNKFKLWLDEGIYCSHVTLVFLTKNFLRYTEGRYQVENAIERHSHTKGQHRVVLVMLDSCRVPRSQRQFNCVYAWKYRQDPAVQNGRILRAIYTPQSRYRRGSIYHRTSHVFSMSTRKQLPHFSTPTTHDQKPEPKTKMGTFDVLFNPGKIQTVLQHCELKCSNQDCTFQCSGENMQDFYKHVGLCKYKMIQCMYCFDSLQRRHIRKHKEKCKQKRISCKYDQCHVVGTVSKIKMHEKICPFRQEVCPSRGCTVMLGVKDAIQHAKECNYAIVACATCGKEYLRAELVHHQCNYESVPCPFCSRCVYRKDLPSHEYECKLQVRCSNAGCCVVVYKGLLKRHLLECEYAQYRCKNTGCYIYYTKAEIKVHDMACQHKPHTCSTCGKMVPAVDMAIHKTACDQTFECEHCHCFVPSSCKQTHDRWLCPAQTVMAHCERCQSCVPFPALERHADTCLKREHLTILNRRRTCDSGEGSRTSARTSFRSDVTSLDGDSDDDTQGLESAEGDELTPGPNYQHSSPQTIPSRSHGDIDNMVLDVLQTDSDSRHIQRSEHADKTSMEEDFKSQVSITPSSREKFRQIMNSGYSRFAQ